MRSWPKGLVMMALTCLSLHAKLAQRDSNDGSYLSWLWSCIKDGHLCQLSHMSVTCPGHDILNARVATFVNCHMSVTCLGHDPVCESGHIGQLSHVCYLSWPWSCMRGWPHMSTVICMLPVLAMILYARVAMRPMSWLSTTSSRPHSHLQNTSRLNFAIKIIQLRVQISSRIQNHTQ